jgi:small subunit ribosomal protein S9
MVVIHTSGKRKRAIARATIVPGKGVIRINKRRLDFFANRIAQLKVKEPLLLAGDKIKGIDVNVRVIGGGSNGQIEAVRLAIARALVEYDKSLESVFDDYDRLLLVADVRRKETRKPGRHSKARSKTQKSYR